MRIISGRFGGRRLVSFKADHIRPTTDRVKETIFNILQNDIPGCRVLDLFSGTGNLGIEALSRGAIDLHFVEKSAKSLAILQQNLKLLGIEKEVTVVRSDVFGFLKDFQSKPFEIIFIDPPFTERIAHPVMEAMATSAALKAGGVCLIESAKQERIDDEYGGLKLLDRRHFGDKALSIFRK